jgi:prepilin-type processing-associated H-X9-DG protein
MLPVTKAEKNTVTLEAIAGGDGASNTLLVGESIGSGYGNPRDEGFAWIASGSHPTYICIPDSIAHAYWYDWSSRHPGMVVNFVLADGSIRGVRPTGRAGSGIHSEYPHNPPTIRERAFWAMSGYMDGDTTTAPGITD